MKKGMIITAVVVILGMSMPEGLFAANANQTVLVAQDEVTWVEVKVEDLPEPVSKSIKEGYVDYSVSKAYQGSDGSYKVDMTKEEEAISVFFNAEGQLLKIVKGKPVDPMD